MATPSLLTALVEAPNRIETRPLHAATTAATVHLLYALRADIEAGDGQHHTPLMNAVLEQYEASALALIDLGAALDGTYGVGMDGWSVLMIAVGLHRTTVAKALLMAGADVNFRCDHPGDFDGYTALILTPELCRDAAQCIEMLQLLLHWGADSSIVGVNGRSATVAVQEPPAWDICRDAPAFDRESTAAMLRLLGADP